MIRARKFEYVLAVLEEGTFSKAAEKLFITQPALSAEIKKIEAGLGHTPIFDRSCSPVRLTKEGEYYVAKMKQLLAIEQELAAHFHADAPSSDAPIRIGSSAFFCNYMLGPIITEFKKQWSMAQFELVETYITEMERMLRNDQLDFILNTDRMDQSIYQSVVCFYETLILAVPADNPINDTLKDYQLAVDDIVNRRQNDPAFPAVDLKLFAKEPFILMKQGHDLYEKAYAFCSLYEFTPHVSLYLDQMITAFHFAKNGQGITFIRDILLDYCDAEDKLCFYKLPLSLARREVLLSYKRDNILSKAEQAFLSSMKFKAC